jgi:Tol biopolymer transport system component
MRYCKHLWMSAAVLCLAGLVGCLPVELSVSPDGDVLIPRAEGFVVYKPADGSVKVWNKPEGDQPVFALYAPDGKSALVLAEAPGGGMGKPVKVMLLDAEGKTRQLASLTNVTYAQWSLDGKFATITRVADQQVAPLDQNLPELILINIAEGTTKTLASNVAGIHRWMPDGKSVVIFQIESKGKNTSQYAGKLTLLNVADGQKKALAGMVGEQGAFFDVSPDGTAAMLTALKVDKPDATLPEKVDGKSILFSLNLASGEFRQIGEDVGFAIYSPKGTKVLIGSATEQTGGIALSVASADGSGMKQVANDAAKQTGGGMGAQATVYPTWLDDDTALYLSKFAVYGTAGTNLMLTTVKADGTGKTIHQGQLDSALIGKK